ncbi:protein of unknown function [Rhodovastum atsumiense]|nr:protein of unknown function [Rhodovastum atsumiense]
MALVIAEQPLPTRCLPSLPVRFGSFAFSARNILDGLGNVNVTLANRTWAFWGRPKSATAGLCPCYVS